MKRLIALCTAARQQVPAGGPLLQTAADQRHTSDNRPALLTSDNRPALLTSDNRPASSQVTTGQPPHK